MIRLALKIAGAVVAVLLLYLTFTLGQVFLASRQDDRTPSNAIVVLGAAQWNGQPSPVLKARLDHAAELWREGVAPVIVVTGGKQVGDHTNEGMAGYTYLRGLGVPDSALKVEVEGGDTYEELSATRHILDDAGIGRSVVIVSSPYHAYRSAAIAEELGLRPHFSGTDEAVEASSLARETAGAALGRLISYRRLSAL